MTQQEHLHLIRAKCVELLELAKRRTPGRWRVWDQDGEYFGIEAGDTSIIVWGSDEDGAGVRTGSNDAAFIASSAGPFEAALASTVAAIDAVLNIAWIEHSEDRDLSWTGNKAFEAARVIIASWPLELLQQQ